MHVNKVIKKQIEVREHLEKVHRRYITEIANNGVHPIIEISIIQNTSVFARLYAMHASPPPRQI